MPTYITRCQDVEEDKVKFELSLTGSSGSTGAVHGGDQFHAPVVSTPVKELLVSA